MYLDEYVISGIVIVVATCIVTGVIGYYGWQHIKEDMKKTEGK